MRQVHYGDYSGQLGSIRDALVEARKHVANDTQGKMVDAYIKSFDQVGMSFVAFPSMSPTCISPFFCDGLVHTHDRVTSMITRRRRSTG